MADISADSARYAFGMVSIGSPPSSHTTTFTNQGDAHSPPLTAVLAGSDVSSFAIEKSGCDAGLGPGESCMVVVLFNPTTTGTLAAQLSFGPSSGPMAVVELSGQGAGRAHLALAATTLDFGSVALTSSVTLGFTATNTGDEMTGILAARILGASGTGFSIASDGCTGRTLSPTSSCTVGLSFLPQNPGGQGATLLVTGRPGGTVLAEVTGRGISAPAGLISPASYTFETEPSATSPSATFTLRNVGAVQSATLPPVTLGGTNGSEFQFLSDSCSGRALAAGTSCMITVAFAPTSPGTKNGQVVVAGFPDGIHAATLVGISRTSVSVALSPSTFDFGAIPVGLIGGPVNLSVSNPGTIPTGPIATSLGGANASEFRIQTDDCNGSVLFPGGTCTIGLTLRPTTAGGKSAQIMATSSPGGATMATITGNAVMDSGTMALSTYAQGFGLQPLRSTSLLPFTLRNEAGGTMTGTITVAISGSPWLTIANDMCSGTRLASVCTFDVQFAPVTGGDAIARVTATALGGGGVGANIGGSALVTFPLQIEIVGPGAVSGPDIGCPGLCSGSFVDGSIATLSATPSPGARFMGWSGGDCSGTGSCAVHIDRPRTVAAVFAPGTAWFTTQVQSSPGAGGTVVARASAGIDCPPVCNVSLPIDTLITLTASAATGSAFSGWSGACVGSDKTCTLVFSRNATATASFVPYNLAFVANTGLSPTTFGGPIGADRICASTATQAGLPGTYRAWIATSSASALDRFAELAAVPRGWTRIDGLPFADSLGAIAAGHVLYPLDLFARAGTSSGADVLTGTGVEGESVPGLDCGNWRAPAPHAVFSYGRASAGSTAWTAYGAKPCTASGAQIYCFGTDYFAPLTRAPHQGRLAFVSEHVFDPSAGIGGADMLCSTEAVSAGLSGTFQAFLATSSSSALSRFDLTKGPWIRTDGVPFVGAATDLMTSPISALSVRASGKYSEPMLVWTGAGGPSCNDWSSAMDADRGVLGYAAETDPGAWDLYLVESCRFARGHLYCLQN